MAGGRLLRRSETRALAETSGLRIRAESTKRNELAMRFEGARRQISIPPEISDGMPGASPYVLYAGPFGRGLQLGVFCRQSTKIGYCHLKGFYNAIEIGTYITV